MGKGKKRGPKTGSCRNQRGCPPIKAVIVPSENFDEKRFQMAMSMLISEEDVIRYFKEHGRRKA